MLDSKTGRWKQQTLAGHGQLETIPPRHGCHVQWSRKTYAVLALYKYSQTQAHAHTCLCMHEYLYPHLYAKLILKVNAAKLFAIRFHLALALSVASTFRLLTSSLSLPLPSFFPLPSLSPLVSDELCGLIFFSLPSELQLAFVLNKLLYTYSSSLIPNYSQAAACEREGQRGQ